jgi:hypothetical protein
MIDRWLANGALDPAEWIAIGGDRHYGFYPSAGRPRGGEEEEWRG